MRVMQRAHDALRCIYQPTDRYSDPQYAPIAYPLRRQRLLEHFVDMFEYRPGIWRIIQRTAYPVQDIPLQVG